MLVISLIIAAVIAAADQLIKYAVVQNFALGDVKELIHGVLSLTHIRNTGAAWSSFSGKTGLLAIVTIVLMLAVVWLLVKRIVRHPLGVTAGVLILGGGIGNLIDRVLNGEVVDYINLLFMRFAVFNFADICVCVGVALWVLVIFLDELHADDAAKEQ